MFHFFDNKVKLLITACSFRASIHLPSKTDVTVPGSRMESKIPGPHW